MLSHSMFLRSTIHLGLVGEMHMHNGKNTPHTTGRIEKESKKRMPGQSGFLSPRDFVLLAEMLEVAVSGSGQLRRQLRVVAGRRESLEPSTTRRVCAASDTERLFPQAGAGGLSPVFLGSQSRRQPRRLVSARKEEVGRRCGIPRQLMRMRAQLLFTGR